MRVKCDTHIRARSHHLMRDMHQDAASVRAYIENDGCGCFAARNTLLLCADLKGLGWKNIIFLPHYVVVTV